LKGLCQLILEIGGDIAVAVASGDGPALATLPRDDVAVGSLEDVEDLTGQNIAAMLVGNLDALDIAERLGVPVLRCDSSSYAIAGGARKTTICYAGARQMLVDLTNLPLAHHHPREGATTRANKDRYGLS